MSGMVPGSSLAFMTRKADLDNPEVSKTLKVQISNFNILEKVES